MNRLPLSKQKTVIHLLLEGCSIRSTERLTGVHRDTIMHLMVRTGAHCDHLMSERICGVRTSVLEVDEAWSYVGKKDRKCSLSEKYFTDLGRQWIFVAMDRNTKLIPAFALGRRTREVATELMLQLKERLAGRPMIVTDALEAYVEAVEIAFGSKVDYTVMTKDFRNGTAYTWAVPVQGNMPEDLVSTSLIERQNLTLRNFVRRMARRTICFSKKLENLRAALSMHFCWYNFGRVHGSLHTTPAMVAGLVREVWEIGRLLPGRG